jgi:signal transduction histidine kinase/ligand-binding sensor domain-containing protein
MILLLAVFGFFSAPSAFSQYRFDGINTDTGLPQNSVYSILQTRDGYLWFTTLDGLVRYNGAGFTVFNRVNTKGINSNRFRCLYEDFDGTLWIGTEEGGLTRYRDGTFTSYTTEDGLPHNLILQIRRTAGGELLVLTQTGVARLKGERFEIISSKPGDSDLEIGYLGPSGATWYRLGTELRRVKDGRTTSYSVPAGGLGLSFLFNQIYEDRRGRLWIRIPGRGKLAVLEGETLTTYTVEDGLPNAEITSFCEDREGILWFGTLNGGLVRFTDGRFTTYTTSDGLSGNRIEAIFADREGTLWLGTFANGIIRVTRQVIATYSEKDGMVGKIFYPIIEDRRGSIWIGNVGVNRFRDGKFTYYPLNISPGHIRARQSFANIQAFFEDRDGRLWIAHNFGLFSFKDEKFTYEDKKPRRGWSNAIYQDRHGYLWLGYRDLLVRYGEGEEKRFGRAEGFQGLVQPIFEDREGRLWIGTYGGLAQYVEGRFVFYTERDGLSSNRVRAIYEDSDGVLWIGTYDGGLNRFKDGKFTSYTTKEGMFSNGVFAILEDARGNFWMSSNQGIHRASRQQLNDFAEGKIARIDSISYGKADGMLNTECNGARQPAAIKTRDGRMWFPTFEGVAVVDSEAVSFNPVPPPVVIEGVRIDRERIDPRGTVEIKPGQSNVEIDYAALSFVKPENVKFKHKLEGLDVDWVDAGNRRVAYYSHVPPGNYIFRVTAANSDGVWNEEGARVAFEVLPPFWRTWWFASLAALSLAALALLMHRRHIAALKTRHAEQQTFMRQLIASQETERKRIATELHDSLGQSLVVIKNCAMLSLTAPKDHKMALTQMSEISDTASQAIGEVKEIAYNLRPYQLDRLGLTKAIEAILARVTSSSTIEFSSEIDRIDGLFSKESEINIYRIVQESLSNIVKHSQSTRARIEVLNDGQAVTIVIEDNGRGFARTSDGDPRKRGLGLVGMAERARVLGAKHEIRSAPGKGTKLTIKLAVQETVNGE